MTHVEAPPVEPNLDDFSQMQAQVDQEFLGSIDRYNENKAKETAGVALKGAEVQDPRDVEAEAKSEAAWDKRAN